jgi:MFS family permease
MAKIADVFGRFEAFCISVFIYVIGYIQMAGSQNVQTYASAQIFYSAGSTGLQILQQVFIADTSDLLNRALFSSLPDIPFLITVWVGPLIASSILSHTTWRWGYGIWAIVLPVAFLPLALALILNQRKAARLNMLPPMPWKNRTPISVLRSIWFELDIMGLLLLSAAIALILIPLTLAATAKGGWDNGSIIAMIVIGCGCLVIFPLWDTNKKLAPFPLLSLRLLRQRTVLAGCGIAFFYFSECFQPFVSPSLNREVAFSFSVQPYFYSYLQVVQGKSVTAAGHITQTFSFTATVSSIAVSLIIKYTRHYKYFVTAGSCIYLIGLGIMIRYRVEGATTGQIVGTQIAVGIGGGMLNVPAQLGVQASASHQEVAAATAIFLTILEIGGAVGSAISGAIWTANIPKKLAQYLPPESQGQAAAIFGSIVTAQSFPMGSPTRIAINRAYQETMNILLIIAVCVAVPLIPLSLLMKNYKLDQVRSRCLPWHDEANAALTDGPKGRRQCHRTK